MEVIHIFEGDVVLMQLMNRDNGLERQCRLYCNQCKLLIAYRQTPPGEPSPQKSANSVSIRFFYIVKGSTTVDPDIMVHEMREYKLRIPSFIRVYTLHFLNNSVILMTRRRVLSFSLKSSIIKSQIVLLGLTTTDYSSR